MAVVGRTVPIQAGRVLLHLNPGLFINNQFVQSVSGKKFPSVNPANGEVIAEVYEADAADVDRAVDAASSAFNGAWGKLGPEKRADYMFKIADLCEKNFDALVALESLDNGKPVAMSSTADVPRLIRAFRYYAGWADKFYGKTLMHDDKFFAYTQHEPMGVCGGIIPWNFPLVMMAWKIAPALATGNTVVLKSSEKTPLSALYFAKLVQEAGLPAGTVNILSGFGPTAGHAIASHMKIRKVAFTGSTRTGKLVMQAAAASNVKKVSLEMGGKSPNIVFEDADLDQAVRWGTRGVFANMGQVCVAGTRVFVQDTIFEKYKQKFIDLAQQTKIGNPHDMNTQHGPQVDKLQFDKILSYIDAGKKEGAKCEFGGSRVGDKGYFIEPTLFTGVTDDMKIVKEEIFGPVGVMIPFSTEEEAIRRANDTEFGLGAAVFTQNSARATRVAHALQAGTVWINCYGMRDIQCAFGGFKQSGIGRECGEYALELYTQTKQVVQNLNAKL